MERKNYLLEELSKEENMYLKKIVTTTRINYMKKNYDFINKTMQLNKNIIDESSDVYDIVVSKLENEYNNVFKFDKMFFNYELYKIVNALSFEEKMVLFLLYSKNKNIREVAQILGVDKNTIINRKNKIFRLIKNNLEG